MKAVFQALGALAALAGAPAAASDLTVVVTNVRNTKGDVHLDLCRQAEFLKDCPISGQTKAVIGTTVIKLHNVPPGEYAIQGMHDENMNGRVDRGLFGIPKEGVAFSNDAPISFGPPKWKDAKFQVAGDMTLTIKMRYFSGPSGPGR